MKSVASTPLRFVGMVIAINAALIAVAASAFAIIASKHLAAVAHRFDSLLDTRRFSSTIHHVDRAGILGLLVAAGIVAGIVLCLRAPRLATLAFLGSAIVGVILTPFVFAIPAFILLNASAFVFFGRKERPTRLTKAKTPPAEAPRVESPPAKPATAGPAGATP
jgi:chromate transport protein ChrA